MKRTIPIAMVVTVNPLTPEGRVTTQKAPSENLNDNPSPRLADKTRIGGTEDEALNDVDLEAIGESLSPRSPGIDPIMEE